MLRIAIDRTCTFGVKTGIGHYTAQLLHHLGRDPKPDVVVRPFPRGLMCVAGVAWIAASNTRTYLRKSGYDQWTRFLGPLEAPFWRYGRALSRRGQAAGRSWVKSQLSTKHFDLYHEPNYLPKPCDLPKVVTIHDLSVFLHPEWHPAKRIAEFEKGFGEMLREASHFITDAECVRDEFIRYFNVPAHKVTCVHPGIGERFGPQNEERSARWRRKLGIEQPGYFLSVGAIEPRKNLLLAMKAYCELPAEMRARHPFVLAGPWGWNWNEVRQFYEAEGSRRGIRHLGYVPDAALPALYHGAKALVYPSLYEGFGLPPLEMAACGGAVLASDIPPLRETLGKRALFVPAHDGDAWRRAMHDAIADDAFLAPFRREGPAIRTQFSWTAAVPKFQEVYRGVVEGGSGRRDRAA